MKHDSGYHRLFSHPHMVEDLLKRFVDQRWVDQLDFSTLERVNAKLHAEGMERRDGDIVYRLCYRDGQALYVLLPARTLTIAPTQADELSEVKQMLSSRIEQWQKEWLEQGIERGIEQGIEQGRLDGEATLLRQQLQRRFGPLPDWVENKLQHAQRKLIEEWGLKLLDAKSLNEIFGSP